MIYGDNVLKNIEAIFAALTRNEYQQLLKQVNKQTKASYKDVKNIRNSQVFKQIFGNKQRIWIKANTDVGDNVQDLIKSSKEVRAYNAKVNRAIKNLLNVYKRFAAIEANKDKTKNKKKYYTETYDKISEYPESELQNNITSWLNNIIYFYDINGRIKKQKATGFIKMLREKFEKYKTNSFLTDVTINEIEEARHLQDQKDTSAPAELLYMLLKNPKDENLWICISRYPADVASMSTHQDWVSCQNLDKHKDGEISLDEYSWHVLYDVSLGTCIAYIISEKDLKKSKEAEPNNPLFPLLHPKGRILIKPWYNENGNIYLSPGKSVRMYGNTKYARYLLDATYPYLESHQSNITGEFDFPSKLYNDNKEVTLIVENGVIMDVIEGSDMEKKDKYGGWDEDVPGGIFVDAEAANRVAGSNIVGHYRNGEVPITEKEYLSCYLTRYDIKTDIIFYATSLWYCKIHDNNVKITEYDDNVIKRMIYNQFHDRLDSQTYTNLMNAVKFSDPTANLIHDTYFHNSNVMIDVAEIHECNFDNSNISMTNNVSFGIGMTTINNSTLEAKLSTSINARRRESNFGMNRVKATNSKIILNNLNAPGLRAPTSYYVKYPDGEVDTNFFKCEFTNTKIIRLGAYNDTTITFAICKFNNCDLSGIINKNVEFVDCIIDGKLINPTNPSHVK